MDKLVMVKVAWLMEGIERLAALFERLREELMGVINDSEGDVCKSSNTVYEKNERLTGIHK